MYTRFIPSKSLSASKSLNKHNVKQITQSKTKKLQKKIAKEVMDEYGQNCFETKKQNKQKTKCLEKVYFTSTATQQTDEEHHALSNKVIQRKQLIKNFPNPNQVSPISSSNSISSISLKKNHKKIYQNRQTVNNFKSEINLLSRNASPKQRKQQDMRQFSTRTSIKEIESPCSSGQSKTQKSNPQIKQIHSKPVKDSTLQITMKNMLKELKQTRLQNTELKEQLIKVKSQQYYCLDRNKVREMVIELDREKQLRKDMQKENLQLKKQNSMLKAENQCYKRENCRVKRINAKIKDQILEVKEENRILRQRVHQIKPSESESEKEDI